MSMIHFLSCFRPFWTVFKVFFHHYIFSKEWLFWRMGGTPPARGKFHEIFCFVFGNLPLLIWSDVICCHLMLSDFKIIDRQTLAICREVFTPKCVPNWLTWQENWSIIMFGYILPPPSKIFWAMMVKIKRILLKEFQRELGWLLN